MNRCSVHHMAIDSIGLLLLTLFMIFQCMIWGSRAQKLTSQDAHIVVPQNGSSPPPDSSRTQLLLALLDRVSPRQRPSESGVNSSLPDRDLRPMTRVHSNLAPLPWVRITSNASRTWGLVLPGSDPRVATDPTCPPLPWDWRLFSGIRPRYVVMVNRGGGLHVFCALVLHHSTGIPKYVLQSDKMNRAMMIHVIYEEIQRVFLNFKEDSDSGTSGGKSSDSPPSPRIMGNNPIVSKNSPDHDNATWLSQDYSSRRAHGADLRTKNYVHGIFKENDGESESGNIYRRKIGHDPIVEPIQSPDTRFVVVLVLFITTLAVLLIGILVYCMICLKAKRTGINQSVTAHSYGHHPAEIPPWFSNNSKSYNFSKTVLNFETSPTASCESDQIFAEDDSTLFSSSANRSHGTSSTATINPLRIGKHIDLTYSQNLQRKLDIKRARPNGAGAVPPVIP